MAQEQWTVATGDARIIDLARIRALRVSVIDGSVDIVGHDEDGARLEIAEVTGRDLTVSLTGDSLEISQTPLSWDDPLGSLKALRPHSASAAIRVVVPRDIAVTLGAYAADTLVSGLSGVVRLNGVAGSLHTSDLRGELDVNTATGEIAATEHSGVMTVNSVSGEITASGPITRFSANTVTGGIFLDITGTPTSVSTRSISADVTARFDAEPDLRISVNTVSGALQLGADRLTGARARGYDDTSAGSGEAPGLIRFSANSVTGNVALLRRTAVHA